MSRHAEALWPKRDHSWAVEERGDESSSNNLHRPTSVIKMGATIRPAMSVSENAPANSELGSQEADEGQGTSVMAKVLTAMANAVVYIKKKLRRWVKLTTMFRHVVQHHYDFPAAIPLPPSSTKSPMHVSAPTSLQLSSNCMQAAPCCHIQTSEGLLAVLLPCCICCVGTRYRTISTLHCALLMVAICSQHVAAAYKRFVMRDQHVLDWPFDLEVSTVQIGSENARGCLPKKAPLLRCSHFSKVATCPFAKLAAVRPGQCQLCCSWIYFLMRSAPETVPPTHTAWLPGMLRCADGDCRLPGILQVGQPG